MTATYDPQVVDVMTAQIKALIESANEKARKIKAATEDVDDSIDAFIADSELEQVAKFREWRDQAMAKIEEIQTALKDQTDNVREFARSQVADDLDFDVEALKSEYLDERRAITSQRKALEVLLSREVLDEALDGVEELIGLKGQSSGTGTPKPRLNSVSVNGEPMDKPTFSRVAAYLKSEFKSTMTAGEIVSEALKAAGTNDWRTLTGEQTFNLTVGDSSVTVTWEPKSAE